ncbi:protein phosphatase 1 regulatory subunit 12B isoform X5 [Ctenopharyngodon idella]|uniref:protein phosphatase 1 regulatory subunit 12B isoform X5 n=1 Tax=Ctenopharyngodon idella TaxID=7959 RepID=UPI0022316219|nr:protein phosphatase 1 regulatory subunit 12B isoform X5 [Ctenopharyngodon idella]
MSSLYSRSKDLSSRSRKSLSDSPPSSPSPSTKTFRQDRASRSDSSGVESSSDRLPARTSTYTRRENRLASLSKTDDDSASKDYKKLYEDALAENEKLKSRLDDSKQELTKIRSQLDRVAQEKEALEKKVSDMEEELKVLTELKSDNQRLKDENGALIRVISKLSK